MTWTISVRTAVQRCEGTGKYVDREELLKAPVPCPNCGCFPHVFVGENGILYMREHERLDYLSESEWIAA